MQMLLSNNLYLLHGKILDRQDWWCLYNNVGNISMVIVVTWTIALFMLIIDRGIKVAGTGSK